MLKNILSGYFVQQNQCFPIKQLDIWERSISDLFFLFLLTQDYLAVTLNLIFAIKKELFQMNFTEKAQSLNLPIYSH